MSYWKKYVCFIGKDEKAAGNTTKLNHPNKTKEILRKELVLCIWCRHQNLKSWSNAM